jgi:hypothetical protein
MLAGAMLVDHGIKPEDYKSFLQPPKEKKQESAKRTNKKSSR